MIRSFPNANIHSSATSSVKQSAEQDVCVQPQEVGVEGRGRYADGPLHVRSGGPQGTAHRGGGRERGRAHQLV